MFWNHRLSDDGVLEAALSKQVNTRQDLEESLGLFPTLSPSPDPIGSPARWWNKGSVQGGRIPSSTEIHPGQVGCPLNPGNMKAELSLLKHALVK